MTTELSKPLVVLAAAAGDAFAQTPGAPSPQTAAAQIKEAKTDEARAAAWQNAAKLGAPAIAPLASLLNDKDGEVVGAAKRALAQIVRHAGRPGAREERRLVSEAFLPLLKTGSPAAVLREILWISSEIIGDESVEAVAGLLSDKELRDDARMVLHRLPGQKSLAALNTALETVPEDFRPNIAVSLRKRGVKVQGYPSKKLVPTKETTVKQEKLG